MYFQISFSQIPSKMNMCYVLRSQRGEHKNVAFCYVKRLMLAGTVAFRRTAYFLMSQDSAYNTTKAALSKTVDVCETHLELRGPLKSASVRFIQQVPYGMYASVPKAVACISLVFAKSTIICDERSHKSAQRTSHILLFSLCLLVLTECLQHIRTCVDLLRRGRSK